MLYHLIAFLLGYLLDMIIGDPVNLPHPIRLIGGVISFIDEKFMDKRVKGKRNKFIEFILGFIMWLFVTAGTFILTGALVFVSYKAHFIVGIVVEAILTSYILAAKSLEKESMRVHKKLTEGTIEEARFAVSMIVGRDTKELDDAGVTRAAVETVAENTSDGVIAPLIYTAIGGPALGLMYKAVNTMDSMVGYHNDRYEYFGKAPARLDDIFNFIPARISALLMILATKLSGPEYSATDAMRVYKSDRKKTKSPNAGQTESVAAGALGIRLGGNASYFGKVVEKEYIGDEFRKIEPSDIEKICKLMYLTELICVVICTAIISVADAFVSF
ncbi:MAG: adenosylcobinamide-phosphate synthase CbiB [Eubacterium sp.]|nr:adenosylcobinamide-phosphate synthase CbiB [Eubacterium sp.]